MSKPLRFLNNRLQAATVVARFGGQGPGSGNSYATVRDFCESIDELPKITGRNGDLKNVQRPWAVKAILAHSPPPAKLLEIGGGEPIVSGFLSELGYDVTLVDPYDGFSHGVAAYQRYLAQFPHVRLVPEYFRPGLPGLTPQSFDGVFSVSVLEHIPADSLPACFDAIAGFLSPTGVSIHCFDFILQGHGHAHDLVHAQQILAEQRRITGTPDDLPFEQLLDRLRDDVETFFLSPQGHHKWRGGQAYSVFPFRKVVSLQTVARRSEA
jgi:hypothetical protein